MQNLHPETRYAPETHAPRGGFHFHAHDGCLPNFISMLLFYFLLLFYFFYLFYL
jgi:hypothetical protein